MLRCAAQARISSATLAPLSVTVSPPSSSARRKARTTASRASSPTWPGTSTNTAVHGACSRSAMRRAARMSRSAGRVGTDAHRETLARGPGVADALAPHVAAHLRIDPMGRLPQCQFAQGDEVALTKESLERAARLVGEVHPALPQPLQQHVGRHVDQLDLVGPLEHGVGHRLAHGDAGDLGHDVIEALDVLHVERGVDVDAGIEQFEHVLPALAVAVARGVGVREFIHEDQRRLPGQRTIEVELLQLASLVVDHVAGKDG